MCHRWARLCSPSAAASLPQSAISKAGPHSFIRTLLKNRNLRLRQLLLPREAGAAVLFGQARPPGSPAAHDGARGDAPVPHARGHPATGETGAGLSTQGLCIQHSKQQQQRVRTQATSSFAPHLKSCPRQVQGERSTAGTSQSSGFRPTPAIKWPGSTGACDAGVKLQANSSLTLHTQQTTAHPTFASHRESHAPRARTCWAHQYQVLHVLGVAQRVACRQVAAHAVACSGAGRGRRGRQMHFSYMPVNQP